MREPRRTTLLEPMSGLLLAAPWELHDLEIVLRYERSDPFAVAVEYPPSIWDDGHPIRWVFARELLFAGLGTACGLCDVQVSPVGDSLVRIKLLSVEGTAMLFLPANEVREFLRGCFELVPLGAEGPELDWAFLDARGDLQW